MNREDFELFTWYSATRRDGSSRFYYLLLTLTGGVVQFIQIQEGFEPDMRYEKDDFLNNKYFNLHLNGRPCEEPKRYRRQIIPLVFDLLREV